MHQTIDGKRVYVVEFDEMPPLPITGLTESEAFYEQMLLAFSNLGGQSYVKRTTGDYARALTDAIKTGVITKPGKYGIHLVPGTNDYEIFEIKENN